MPVDTSIKSVLVIGSGPIVIGQACEFDYSGTQACRVLRAEGIRVILVNSNPATIMTDPEFADATYIEPITPEFIERIIIKEKPDAVLATLGGQTALNAAIGLYELGTLAKYGVKLIGADVDAIKRGENRELFRGIVEKVGGESAKSVICHTMEQALSQTLTSIMRNETNTMTTSPRLTDSEQLDLERFKYARTSEKLNTVSIALVVDELIRGMHKLGIKGDKIPNKEELSVMYKSIVEEYPNIKLGELTLAFDLASKGKLDMEAETYQNFSVLYLHRLLRAFARYGMQKLNEIKPLEESKWNPRFISDDEKIETAFDCFKKFRQWDNIVFGVDVFKILHKRGNIIVTPSETYEKVLTAMNEKMFEGSRQDKIDIKNKMKDDDYMEHQCYRMAVSDYFTKLINKG